MGDADAPLSPPPLSSDDFSPIVYELVAAEELPALDLTTTIKSKLLSPQTLHAFNHAMFRLRHVVTMMFNVAESLVLVVFMNPGGAGFWLAPIVTLLQFPGVVVMTAPIRHEMALLLMQSYDFWFFSVANTLGIGSAAIAMRDIRVVLLPLPWMLSQDCILIDAQIRDLRHVIGAAVVTILFYTLLLTATILRLTDAAHDEVLFEYAKRSHAMTTRDIMMNSLMTMLAFFARMGYRKWTGHVQRSPAQTQIVAGETPRTIKCIGYHCRVKLCPVRPSPRSEVILFETSPTAHIPARSTRSNSSRHNLGRTSTTEATRDQQLTQLLHSRVNKRFDARDTVLPRLASCLLSLHHHREQSRGVTPALTPREHSQQQQQSVQPQQHQRGVLLFLLYATGFAGFALPAAYSLTLISPSGGEGASSSPLPIAGFAASCVFCGAFLAFYQRELLIYLCRSFNFAFLSLQITAAHVCVMDFFAWDARTALVGTSWLWIHWVMTLDALTPAMRRVLGFHHSYAVPVLMAFIAVQVRIVLELTWWKSLDIVDRQLHFGVIAGREIQMHVVPFFLSRLLTVFIWSCRLLWHMLKLRDANELVMVSGEVEFAYDPHRGSARSSATGARAQKSARKSRGLLRWGAALLGSGKVVPFAAKKRTREPRPLSVAPGKP